MPQGSISIDGHVHAEGAIIDQVVDFLRTYRYDDDEYYMKQIRKMVFNNERSINLNFTHLAEG